MAPPRRFHLNTLLELVVSIAYLHTSTRASPTDPLSSKEILGSSFGTPINSTYDYVIVGGGNAGLVLANRLSFGNHTVAVIEAGSFYEIDNGNVSQIPRYVWSGVIGDVNPLVDWEFETEPEAGIGGAKMHYPRGKTLGGSSARNNMIYQRPTKGSLQKWAEDVGDESYRWENFRKFYDKSVVFHPADTTRRLANSTPTYDPAGDRATSGPVSLSYANYVLPFTSWAIRAAEAMGLKSLSGYLDGDLIGSSWHMQTTDPRTMVRDSSETAYLRPALNRTNLVVHSSTMALKILFEGTHAVGVACSTAEKDFTLTARKEVILSAGAFQSPQLLMVSGIGPQVTLEEFDIQVLVDAPGVGQGMEVNSPQVSNSNRT
jgi:choline dehydrogenase